MSDIFLTGKAQWNGEKQKTDINWRSMDGKGFFNWRWKFKVDIPTENSVLKVQVE